MKKVYSSLLFVLTFLLFALFMESNVANASYKYGSGNESYYKEDVEVISFNYEYKTKFAEVDGFYNGEEIFDDGKSLADQWFYGSSHMTIQVKHVDKFAGKDNDKVEIRRYISNKQRFSSIIKTFDNEEGSFELKDEGLYKLVYYFDNNVECARFVYITSKIHSFNIFPNSSYDTSSAQSNFLFRLVIEDGYDLRQNTYYYAFGEDDSNLSYLEFEVFTQEEMEKEEIVYSIDKSLSVRINELDETEDGVKKRLYIKVVKNLGNGSEISEVKMTSKGYALSQFLTGSFYFVDDNNEKIEEIYLKNGDTLNVKIEFQIPVKVGDVEFSLDGENYFKIEKANEELVGFIEAKIELVEGSSKDSNYENFSFRNVDDIVSQTHGAVLVKVNCKTNYYVDNIKPNISVEGDSNEIIRNQFDVTLYVKEFNLYQIKYYVEKCNSFAEGKCVQAGIFNEENKNMIVVDESAFVSDKDLGMNEVDIIIDGKEYGDKINGVSLILYVKAEDEAGNVTYSSFIGYVVDNVIISDFNSIVLEEDIKTDDVVTGKRMYVSVPLETDLKSLEYRYFGSENYNECEIYSSDENETVYECVKVEGYYFSSLIEYKFVDKYNNEEIYTKMFTYNDLTPKQFKVGDYIVNVYNDKEYDAEISGVTNYVGVGSKRITFDKQVLDKLVQSINLYNVPNIESVVTNLIYINLDEEIKIVENIGESLIIPSFLELIKKFDSTTVFEKCAFKGETCDVDTYLQYTYKVNGIYQSRVIKLTLVDNTIKMDTENFSNEVEVDVLSQFKYYEYKYYDIFNNELTLGSSALVNRVVLLKNANGLYSEVNYVDANKVGSYLVKEFVVNGDEGSFPVVYEVNVVDKKAPILVLNGAKEIVIKEGEKLENLLDGISASDEYDKDLEIFYEVDSKFDANKAGEYIIKYWTIDSSGNKSNEIVRKIIVEYHNTLMTYLIVGGIGLFVVLVMVLGISIEVKKERRKS